jgi:3-hydroxybutyryl-CoA dehydrogenase
MGSGIAEVGAKAGIDVVVFEIDEGAVSAGRAKIEDSLDRELKRGKLTEDERGGALGRIRFSTDYEAMADRELVIEAVAENADVKMGVFKALDAVMSSPDAVLASNTSSIPIMRLATATSRPEKVLGLHFFNPVPVMRLVELVPSLLTDEASLELAGSTMREQLDKLVVTSKDRSGFIVNALLVPYQLAAIRMLESGFASAEDIDTGVVEGLAHPMGPLSLADLIGLDTILAVADSLYAEFREQLYAPPPLLCRMVEAGLLGRKTGRGFFNYSL